MNSGTGWDMAGSPMEICPLLEPKSRKRVTTARVSTPVRAGTPDRAHHSPRDSIAFQWEYLAA